MCCGILAVIFYPKLPILRKLNTPLERVLVSGGIMGGTLLAVNKYSQKALKEAEDSLYLKNGKGFEDYVFEGEITAFPHWRANDRK